MPIEIPEGFGQVLLRFRLDGDAELMVTSLGFRATAGDTHVVMAAAAGAVVAALQTNLFPAASALVVGWNVDSYQATMNTSDAGVVVAEIPVNIAGTFSGSTPVCNLAVLVRKMTGLGGRKHRGRMFMPPANLTESNVSAAGILETAYVTGQQTKWNDAYDDMITVGVIPVLLHQEVGLAPDDITQFIVQARTATQRRRLRP